jgi:hypothetical protein
MIHLRTDEPTPHRQLGDKIQTTQCGDNRRLLPIIGNLRRHGRTAVCPLRLQIERVEIEWKKASVRRGDHADIQVRPLRIGNSTFTLEFDVLHGEQRECVAIGRTVYVCVSADQDGKSSSRSIPPVLREALTGDLS